MLVELAVRDLGVIAEARFPLSEGMTALTGETGAGKTLLVEALRLLCGEKADPGRVRTGADEAVVEGLFALDETEWVLRRVVPASGRSRCYLNGELVPAARLAELGAALIEIHGQHGQQALLDPRQQRAALDQFAHVDRSRLDAARRTLGDLRDELEGTGGDDRARERQLELLEHQVTEIATIAPGVDEDDDLSVEEDLLAGAMAYRQAAGKAIELIGADGATADQLARARATLGDAPAFAAVSGRLAGLEAELADCSTELRALGEGIEPDEERLAVVRARRQALVELRRKYGETIAEVLAFAEDARSELEWLRGLAARREELGAAVEAASAELLEVSRQVGGVRRAAAPRLAAAATDLLGDLALGDALIEVEVADTDDLPGAGEAVELRLAANAGQSAGPLARVASGGELSRVMLALRLVLSGGPPTMVFDEVDAGVGGAAASAVGAALARLSGDRQVLVVTHLAQVAAAADFQVTVDKQSDGQTTSTEVRLVSEDERVVEISRMLSGSPDSVAARRHAAELLSASAVEVVP